MPPSFRPVANFAKQGPQASDRPAPLADAAAYQAMLEQLLAHGETVGKVEPVAGYLLRPVFLMTEKELNLYNSEKIFECMSKYIVMDLQYYPSAYGRSLTMQGIAVSYAKRIIGEGDINAPDFKGPGVWTSKKDEFEFDYLPRPGSEVKDQYGRPSRIYDPNPEASRICLTVTEPITIPTAWGDPWEVKAGGTIIIRERDVKKLSIALQAIHEGLVKPEDILYNGDNHTARIDIYGMPEGFLKDNYNAKAPKAATIAIQEEFKKIAPTTSMQRILSP